MSQQCEARHPETGVACFLAARPHSHHLGSGGANWPDPDYQPPAPPKSKADFDKGVKKIKDGINSAKPPTPVLPYNGDSGWSGSDASRDRAYREDASGITADSQRRVYDWLAAAGADGVTVAEIREPHTDLHHGAASGALSVLHLEGYIARLKDRRGECSIYVLPQHINGRQDMPRKGATPEPEPVAEPAPVRLRHFA